MCVVYVVCECIVCVLFVSEGVWRMTVLYVGV